MKLFLAEDDEILADALRSNLHQSGFEVDCEADGGRAVACLLQQDYAVAVLDIGLPTLDGLAVLRQVRVVKPNLPILLLTAFDGLDQRVAGLDAGADDYLTKPFDFPELDARLRALLRRSHLLPPSVQQFGPLRFDRIGQRAWCDDLALDLSARELAVLDMLLTQRDKVVTKEQLAHLFGPNPEEVGANTIEVCIHRLRKKLEPCTVEVRTVRGLGYLLECVGA